MRQSTTFAIAAALLAGCANIKDDDARTRTEGALAGTAGGAVLGGLLGGLMSLGSPDAIVRGALSGGASGGATGYLYGRSVAYRKKEYATAEAHLDACIAEAKRESAASREYNAQARRILANQRRQLAAWKAAPPPTRVQQFRETMETNLANLETGLQHWQIIIDAHKRVLKQTRDRQRRDTLAGEIRDLAEERSHLQENKRHFLEIQAQIPQ